MKLYHHSDNVFFFEGCVSLQTENRWVSPWRIPYHKQDFYPFLKDGVAHDASGVRLYFSTDSTKLQIKFLAKDPELTPTRLDLFINNKPYKEVDLSRDNMVLDIDAPAGMNDFIIYLPTDKAVWLQGCSMLALLHSVILE